MLCLTEHASSDPQPNSGHGWQKGRGQTGVVHDQHQAARLPCDRLDRSQHGLCWRRRKHVSHYSSCQRPRACVSCMGRLVACPTTCSGIFRVLTLQTVFRRCYKTTWQGNFETAT